MLQWRITLYTQNTVNLQLKVRQLRENLDWNVNGINSFIDIWDKTFNLQEFQFKEQKRKLVSDRYLVTLI